MLYITIMTTKLNQPEDIGISPRACFRDSFKAGAAWMILVYLTDIPGLYVLSHHASWPLALRCVITLVPLLFAFQYVRSIARWIRGMDELHRALSVESFAFATVAYLFIATAWFLFGHAGLWNAISDSTNVHLERIPWNDCTFIICMIHVLFGIGYSIFKRRFQ
jgi:hypothetical protein